MINSYLLDIIRALPPEEWKAAGQMIVSPPFGSHKNAKMVLKLFQVICATAPEFSESRLDKKYVYAQLFPERPWVQGKLDKLMVELSSQLRQYILFKRFLSKNNEPNAALEWIAFLKESQLTDRAIMMMEKLQQAQQAEAQESLEQYELRLRIALETHNLYSYKNLNNDPHYIPEFLEQLEMMYVNYKLDFNNRYTLLHKIKSLPSLQPAPNNQDYYTEKSLLFSVSIRIEQLLSQSNIQPAEVISLLSFLQENEHRFDTTTLWGLFGYLRSLCSISLDNGQLDIIPVMLAICKDNLNRGIFQIHGGIPPNTYINLVQVAAKAKDFEWANEVTEKFKNRLLGGDKDMSFYRLNKAQCLSDAGQYDAAIAILPLETSHHVIQMLARRLEVKLYYEIKSELFEYKLMAYRKYLERAGNKFLTPKTSQMCIGFFNILKQISQSPRHDPRRAQQLLERIQKKKLVSDRIWLMEKAAELGRLPNL